MEKNYRKLPKSVIGLNQKSWDLFKDLAHLRSHKIQKADSYDFNEIVREENADQRVFIPHKPKDDKLWYERIPMEEKSFNANLR